MQSKTSQSDGLRKRKRTEISTNYQKRAKSESSSENENPEEEIIFAEQAILESKKNYNKIKELLNIAQEYEENSRLAMMASVSLCRVFIQLLAVGNLTMKKSLSDKEAVVVQWLKDRLSEYRELLLDLLSQEELSSSALTLSLRTLQAEGQYLSDKDEYTFPKVFLTQIIKILLYTDIGDDVRQEFVTKYVQKYHDIRFFTFKAIEYDPFPVYRKNRLIGIERSLIIV